jgi:hypothetical protein
MTPELPSPEAVRAACAFRCWDDDCDDVSRVLLEQAADTIRKLMRRCVRLSRALEASEFERSQKGGAA